MSPASRAALVCILALSLPAASGAQALGAETAPHLLTVTGHGESKGVPDRATLSTGVVTSARTAREALGANAQAMNAVFAALKRAGVEERNIQTSNVEITPQFAAQKPGISEAPRIAGYQATNTVSVTVDGLDRLGATIDALVSAGSNQIEGPSFSLADPKPLEARARAQAVRDATERARTLAEAAGVTLGPMLSIAEGTQGMTYSRPRGMLAMADAAPTPIAPGEQSLSVDVTITWEIH
ncbi:MAG: SIMPL domain-containing protein [Alphaproteobacteria bacterium]|nr:SIMPL domain-containing protein [Alphaproteobacteria bacterium]MBV9694095.1 SIMPL domain-containing protein [Alphaproteobacteria bacterium]